MFRVVKYTMVRLVYNHAPAMAAESPVNPATKVGFDFWHDNGPETKKACTFTRSTT